MASAQAIERLLSQEPGLRWRAATETVNHHTLSDFRVGHSAALEELFAQFPATLEQAGLVDLRTILRRMVSDSWCAPRTIPTYSWK